MFLRPGRQGLFAAVYVFELYNWVLLFSAGFALSVALLAWRRREAPGARSLLVLELFVAQWCVATALDAAAVSEDLKFFWCKVAYVGIVGAPLCFLHFALSLGQFSPTRRRVILMAASVAATCACAALTPAFAFWKSARSSSSLFAAAPRPLDAASRAQRCPSSPGPARPSRNRPRQPEFL